MTLVSESYARVYRTRGELEITIGIALLRDDELEWITDTANTMVNSAFNRSRHPAKIVRILEDHIKELFPGRPHFIESEEDGKGVQVYSFDIQKYKLIGQS